MCKLDSHSVRLAFGTSLGNRKLANVDAEEPKRVIIAVRVFEITNVELLHPNKFHKCFNIVVCGRRIGLLALFTGINLHNTLAIGFEVSRLDHGKIIYFSFPGCGLATVQTMPLLSAAVTLHGFQPLLCLHEHKS